MYFHRIPSFRVFPPTNGWRGVGSCWHGTRVSAIVPIISPCGCHLTRGQDMCLTLHRMFGLHRETGHGGGRFMERAMLTVTSVVVSMLAATQAAWMVNFALMRKDRWIESWVTGRVKCYGRMNFWGVVETPGWGTGHGTSCLRWFGRGVEFNMADAVDPTVLVTFEAVTRIVAEVGWRFGWVIRQETLADLTSSGNVYTKDKEIQLIM